LAALISQSCFLLPSVFLIGSAIIGTTSAIIGEQITPLITGVSADLEK
jgi:hypothetical protein